MCKFTAVGVDVTSSRPATSTGWGRPQDQTRHRGLSTRRVRTVPSKVIAFVAFLAMCLLAAPAIGVTLRHGDIVADDRATKTIVRVDPITGSRTTIAPLPNFTVAGIAVDADGNVLVAGWQIGVLSEHARVIRIDPVTGVATVVSAGGLLVQPNELDVAPDGGIIVADQASIGKIIEINPASGAQRLIGTGTDGSLSTGLLTAPYGIALEPTGSLLVTNRNTVSPGLVRMDRATGSYTILAAGEPPFETPYGVAVDRNGGIVVADTYVTPVSPEALPGAVIRVDPASGETTTLLRGSAPFGIAVADDGAVFFTKVGGISAIVRLDPTTGATTDLSTGFLPLVLAIANLNRPPIAVDDSYVTNLGETLSVTPPGVLGNDTDPEGAPLTASLVAGPLSGELSLAPDGSFTYVPAPGATGTYSFTYRVSDGISQSAPAAVTIRVNAPPAPVDDAYTLAEDTTLTIDPPGVLVNDSDPEGDPIRVLASEVTTAHGKVALNEDGSLTYTPDPNFNGSDQATYTVADNLEALSHAVVTITVTPAPDPPAAMDDTYSGVQSTNLQVIAPGVLANDSDPDGDLSADAVLISGPTNGQLTTFNADGSFSYQPNAGFSGPDFFTYIAQDRVTGEQSQPATVRLNIRSNSAPVARADSFSTLQDTTLTVAAPGVLVNDTDDDGDVTFVAVGQTTQHGALALESSGAFTYVPEQGFSGTDSFTYTLFDGSADSSVTTVTITVTPSATVSVADAAPVVEGDTGLRAMNFVVTRTGSLAQPATVRFHTEDGTATGGQDYQTPLAANIDFAAGIATQNVSVRVVGEYIDESDEVVRLVLDSSTGAPIGDGDGLGTIVDDDPPGLTIGDRSVAEGQAATRVVRFTVTLDRRWNREVRVGWRTEDITATAGSDYVSAAGTAVVAVGSRTATFDVVVRGDRSVEPNEQFRVILSDPVQASIEDGEAIGTIVNDD